MAPNFDQVFPVLYKGWDRTSALADFNAGNWRNKAGADQFTGTSSSTSSDPAQQIIDIATQTQAKANQAFKDYSASNPFNYDQVLAQKTQEAKQQLDPYYNETLSDYLLGVTRKVQNSATDTRDLLGELSSQNQSYGRDTQLKLKEAIDKAGQGFADAGLFDSGARMRDEGLNTATSQNATSDFLRGQDYRANQANKANADVLGNYGLGNYSQDNPSAYIPGLAARSDIRNQARDQLTNTNTLAKQLTGEAGQEYVAGFNQTLPPELQANNNFDILKQIGIYS